jgi:hypothetical protein
MKYDRQMTQLYIRHYFLEEPKEPWIVHNQEVCCWHSDTGASSFIIEGEVTGCHKEPLLYMAKCWRIGPFAVSWDSWIYGFIQSKPYHKFRVPMIGMRFWGGWGFSATRTFNIAETKSGIRKWGVMVQYYKLKKRPSGTAQSEPLFKSPCFNEIKPPVHRTKTK